MEGLERGDDLLEEVEVDGGEGAGVDVGFGLAEAEVDGFVGADVQEGAGVFGGELGELLLDEGEGAGLAGGEDCAVGVSASGWYCSQVRTLWRWPKASCSGTMVTW
jgi:hypothetical protein